MRLGDDQIQVIVVDDDRDVRENMVDLLSTIYPHISEYESPRRVLKQIQAHDPIVILTDLRMPDGDGLEFAKAVREIDPDIPLILMTGYGDISTAVDAMKHGVYDFIEKPVDADRLLKSLQRAVEKRLLNLSLTRSRQQLEQHVSIDAKIIGQGPMIKQLKKEIIKLAPMNIPVLIYGDTGTGKELVAHCLHEFSLREGPFVALNCAAIPDHLAEAELFGYEKGAFTDASASRVGKLEYANGGTLFLDEVESLSTAIQAKLLRVLQDGRITRLGSNQETEVDCRIISAAKEDLRNHEAFRQDLYFRLQVGECWIPALRDRQEDILLLFEYFCLQACDNFKIEHQAMNTSCEQALLSYDWPGNVREMINIATRYVINGCRDIDQVLQTTGAPTEIDIGMSLKQRVAAFEENLLRSKFAEHQGNVSAVMDDLQIERRNLNQKMTRYQINSAEYKDRKKNS